MRNLVLLGEYHREVTVNRTGGAPDDDGARLRHADDQLADLVQVPNVNSSESEITTVILTKQGLLLPSTTATAEDGLEPPTTTSWTVCDLNQVCQHAAASLSQWFQLTYVDPHLVALSKSGAIVTVNPWTGEAELVGEFDHGIEAGVWSPDRELLSLVTFAEADDEEDDNNGQIQSQDQKSVLLTMNSQWEVLSEINFEPHIPSSSSSVGEPHSITKTEAVSIAWRPDGTLCAVSSVDVVDQTRKIRIYERDGLQLHALGRAEDGGGKLVPNLVGDAGLAWASAGCSHLLTAVQRKGTSAQQVVFFEPNGLRHREFTIRDGGACDVLGLTWNVTSDLLALWLRDKKEDGNDKVQLWHRSNYHWYLKQEFQYGPGQRVTGCMFHNEQAHLLYIGLSPGIQWREYELRWDPSTVRTTIDSCTAVVIDGNTLNLTPFEKAIVPPPMYAANLTMDLPVRQVCFAPGNGTVSTIVQLSNGSLVLLGGEGNQSELVPSFTAPKIIASATWKNLNGMDPSLLRSLVVVAEESGATLRLVAIYPPLSNKSCDSLVEISVDLTEGGQASATVINVSVMEGRVLRMVPWSDGANGALLQLTDGQLLEFEFSGDGPSTVLPSSAEPLLEPCPWMAALYDSSRFTNDSHRERLVVGMTERSRLYCHDRLLCDAVSSFILSPTHSFLSYATSGSHCQLRFLPIAELLTFDPLMGLDDNNLLEGFEPRHVERGARLVALVSSHPTAVLQMPRGNLEGIYPRALVLPFVISSIVRGAYDEAFTMMRRQKVDLNLIVDADPIHFLAEGAWRLVEQVKPIDHLNLFISSLHNWDSTKTKYSVASWLPRRNDEEDEAKVFDVGNKTNLVCSKLRSIMLQAESDGHTQGGRTVVDGHFLLPVLSTFAKEDPPKLKEALTLIKDNAISKHPATSRKPPLFSERAQSSIQYLAFLANYELLFETALGIYDFELARSIARNSQMDPKVYLPLIQRFKSLPEYYAKFQVDLRLKRYEAALSNLFESGEREENLEHLVAGEAPDPAVATGNDFETCLSFITEHSLHSQGLKLFERYPEKRRQIMLSLGNHLLENKEGDTALTVYLAATPPDYDGAKRAARMAGDWRFFFSLAVDHPDSDDSIAAADKRSMVAHEVAHEIADSAAGSQNRRQGLASAAQILLDYGKDVGAALDMLISAEMWDEGLRVARLHSREDLARRCVEAAIAYGRTLITDFDEKLESFLAASNRYGEVLKIRKQAAGDENYGEGGELVGDETGSFFSAASNASVDSLRSTTSSASMGSVTSISSIISVKSSNTFSFKGEHSNRHKSKFNKAGGEKKKATKKKAQKRKMRPGSEEELKSVVDTMKASFVDTEYCAIIASTISFLCHFEMIDLAGHIYRSYGAMKKTVNDVQLARIESAKQERIAEERRAVKEGVNTKIIILPIETEVDALSCPDLPQSLHKLFEFIT